MARRASPRSKIRYAVVGLGYIAQAAVLPAFKHASKNSVLHALVSGDEAKLAEVGDMYEVPVRGTYADYDACLQEVDAVFICTPNTSHAEQAVGAAQAGVHVLCEKPLAVTSDECDRITRACADAKVKLMTAYRLHFEPLFLEIVARTHRGEIGELRYFQSSFSMHAYPDGIRTRRETGGGTLYDLGVYCINAACLLFQEGPTQVYASAVFGARSGMPDVDDTTAALLRFERDRLATFTTSFASGGVSDFRIVGTEGDIHAEPAYSHSDALAYTMTVGTKTLKRKGRRRGQFAAELLYFSDCILRDREPEPSGEEGTRDVRIVEALYESARRAAPVDLEPFEPDLVPGTDQAISRPSARTPALVHVQKPHD